MSFLGCLGWSPALAAFQQVIFDLHPLRRQSRINVMDSITFIRDIHFFLIFHHWSGFAAPMVKY